MKTHFKSQANKTNFVIACNFYVYIVISAYVNQLFSGGQIKIYILLAEEKLKVLTRDFCETCIFPHFILIILFLFLN